MIIADSGHQYIIVVSKIISPFKATKNVCVLALSNAYYLVVISVKKALLKFWDCHPLDYESAQWLKLVVKFSFDIWSK